jgi:hypothetical protein
VQATITGSFAPLTAQVSAKVTVRPELLFSQPPVSNGDLVFGDTGEPGVVHPDVQATITGSFAPLSANIQIAPATGITITGSFAQLTANVRIVKAVTGTIAASFAPLSASVAVTRHPTATITASFAPLQLASQAEYNSNTARPTVGQSAAAWQVGTSHEQGTLSAEQVASKLPIGWQDKTDSGTLSAHGFEHRLPDVLLPNTTQYSAPIQEATGSHNGTGAVIQNADHSIRLFDIGRFQDGTPARYSAKQCHQDGDHRKRAWLKGHYQEATKGKHHGHTGAPKSGTRYLFGRATGFQDGRVPPAGISLIVPVNPHLPIVNSTALVFIDPWSADTALVFGQTSGTPDALTLYILPARFYMAIHTLTAQRLPDLTEIPLFDASVASDSGSFCWTLNASGPSSLFALLQPESGLPARLRVTIDGIPFVFAIDSLNRSNAFGKTGATISGRSVTALIGAPYLRPSVYTNTQERTAQQLAVDALTNTGITLDWGTGAGNAANSGLVDWIVPTGAWSFQGTPLSAVQQIAQAAGGYLQSHRSAATLLTRHPYGMRALDMPGAPWGWSTGAADVELATDALITEAITRADGADINAVYVSGTTQGVLAQVKRTGSAADKLGAMATDPLITHADAARQRGLSILGAAGPKHSVRLELPVLTGQGQPGILDVGQLVQINTAAPWRGRVRAVNVAANWPRLRQSVTIERHLETV